MKKYNKNLDSTYPYLERLNYADFKIPIGRWRAEAGYQLSKMGQLFGEL